MNAVPTPAAPWVLLRGWTREARHWGAFADLLRAAAPGTPVVALDLPGNGRLHAQASPTDVAAMAAHCRAALRAQGLAPPYRVLALSLGAMVALAWAEAAPRELAAAVLVNTSLRPHATVTQRLRPRQLPALLGLLWRDPGPEARERTVLRLTSRLVAADAAAREALLRDWVAWAREHPVTRANTLRQLRAALRCRAPARPPDVPLLLLASAQDALVDPASSRRLAAAWRLPLVEHPRAGHDLPLDDPDWLLARLAAWPPAAG